MAFVDGHTFLKLVHILTEEQQGEKDAAAHASRTLKSEHLRASGH